MRVSSSYEALIETRVMALNIKWNAREYAPCIACSERERERARDRERERESWFGTKLEICIK